MEPVYSPLDGRDKPAMDATQQNWLQIPTRRELTDRLDRVEMSADAKALIGKLMDATITVAGKVMEIGRQVLGFVFGLIKRFRGITFGVCIGLTVSSLIATVPLVGGALAALLGPLLVAFGLTLGALDDVRNGALRDEIAGFGSAMTASTHA
jgi:hypothetical protein